MECGPEREALTFSPCFTECTGYWVARMSAQALVLVFVPGSPWPPFPVRRDQGDPWAGSTGGSVECARLSCSRTAGFQQSSHVKIIFQQTRFLGLGVAKGKQMASPLPESVVSIMFSAVLLVFLSESARACVRAFQSSYRTPCVCFTHCLC